MVSSAPFILQPIPFTSVTVSASQGAPHADFNMFPSLTGSDLQETQTRSQAAVESVLVWLAINSLLIRPSKQVQSSLRPWLPVLPALQTNNNSPLGSAAPVQATDHLWAQAVRILLFRPQVTKNVTSL